MKSIKLKAAEDQIGGAKIIFTTYELLRTAVNNTPEQGGFSVDEMMKRLRILDKLDEYKDAFTGNDKDKILESEAVLELEDSDFEKLKTLFAQVKWGVISKFIVDLSQEINSI